MKKRTKKILMIGGGVLIAYLLYKHFRKKPSNKTLSLSEEQLKKIEDRLDNQLPSNIKSKDKGRMLTESQKDRVFFKDPMPKLKPDLSKPFFSQDAILRSASINKDVPKYVQPYSQNIQIMMPNGELMSQAVTQKMIDDNPDLEVFYEKNGYITSDQWQTAKGNISGRMPTGVAIF